MSGAQTSSAPSGGAWGGNPLISYTCGAVAAPGADS